MSNELSALIFDVDGTLADNEQQGHRVAFNRAFADTGLDWYWDEPTYARLLEVYGGKERIRHFIAAHRPDFDPPADSEAFVQELHALKTRHYIGLVESGVIPLRPGVGRLLREAREACLQLAIASTTTRDNVAALLTHALGQDSMGWFAALACGDEAPRKKPAPDVYELVLARLGLPPSRCLAIEDSESGLAAATAAGLITVITVNEATRDQDFSAAAIVLDQLGEPGCGFKVLAGDARGARLVDVALLRRLHSAFSAGGKAGYHRGV